jgi:uncharacterized membrane protein
VLRGALRASVSTFVQDATTLAGAVAVSRAGGPTRCATTRSLGYIPVVPCEPGAACSSRFRRQLGPPSSATPANRARRPASTTDGWSRHAHIDPATGHPVRAHRHAGARLGPAEARWPVVSAVLAVIALQMLLPQRLAFSPHWLLPAVQFALLAGIVAVNPGRVSHSQPLRMASLALIVAVSLANVWSATLLVAALVRGGYSAAAGPLLATGAAIWITNVVVFALWYWELDAGGPACRAGAQRVHPDFLFTQMQAPELTDPGWEPRFVDYLYLSFTTATAFSPTDTLPLTRWAKLLMMLQSAISLSTLALVIARAVNILG